MQSVNAGWLYTGLSVTKLWTSLMSMGCWDPPSSLSSQHGRHSPQSLVHIKETFPTRWQWWMQRKQRILSPHLSTLGEIRGRPGSGAQKRVHGAPSVGRARHGTHAETTNTHIHTHSHQLCFFTLYYLLTRSALIRQPGRHKASVRGVKTPGGEEEQEGERGNFVL